MDGPRTPNPAPDGPERPRPPGPPWHPVGRVGLYLALFLAIQVVVAIPAVFLWATLTRTNPITMLQGDGAAAYTLFVYACIAPVLAPLTVAFLRRFDGKTVAELGARAPEGGVRVGSVQALVAIGAAFGILGLWLLAVAVLGEVAGSGLAEGFTAGAGPFRGVAGGALLLAVQALGFLVQGGVEEWVFRGYVLRTLRERWSWASAAGASSLVFAVFHSMNQTVDAAALVNTFLLGLMLAAALELTGSLLACTIFHGGWNFAMAGVLSLPVSGVEIFHLLDLSVAGPAWLTGGDYGPEASWALTVLLVPAVVVLATRVDRRAAQPSP